MVPKFRRHSFAGTTGAAPTGITVSAFIRCHSSLCLTPCADQRYFIASRGEKENERERKRKREKGKDPYEKEKGKREEEKEKKKGKKKRKTEGNLSKTSHHPSDRSRGCLFSEQAEKGTLAHQVYRVTPQVQPWLVMFLPQPKAWKDIQYRATCVRAATHPIT